MFSLFSTIFSLVIYTSFSIYGILEIELSIKSFIIEAYENDTVIDIDNLQKSQNILIKNFEDY